MLESLDAAKEPEFAWREPLLGFEFRRQQTQRADQIGHLEQLVVTWFNGLRKLDDRDFEFTKTPCAEDALCMSAHNRNTLLHARNHQ